MAADALLRSVVIGTKGFARLEVMQEQSLKNQGDLKDTLERLGKKDDHGDV